ncbi:hypothetical protein C8R44DRAFT_157042 [Mycena epipterygia]|nr:hypothetical protein C8R44DRAFT_157042 [Mycena epipterygia]
MHLVGPSVLISLLMNILFHICIFSAACCTHACERRTRPACAFPALECRRLLSGTMWRSCMAARRFAYLWDSASRQIASKLFYLVRISLTSPSKLKTSFGCAGW